MPSVPAVPAATAASGSTTSASGIGASADCGGSGGSGGNGSGSSGSGSYFERIATVLLHNLEVQVLAGSEERRGRDEAAVARVVLPLATYVRARLEERAHDRGVAARAGREERGRVHPAAERRDPLGVRVGPHAEQLPDRLGRAGLGRHDEGRGLLVVRHPA